MPFFLVVCGVVLALLLVLFVGMTSSPKYLAGRARQMSASVGLALDPDVQPIVERAIAVRLRATGIGASVGLVIGAANLLGGPFAGFGQWLSFGTVLFGLGLGSAVGAYLARPRPASAGVRVARARDVRLQDYVTPLELTGARVVVGVTVVTATIVAALIAGRPSETTSFASLVIFTTLAAVSLIVFEVAGRAIVAQPSPADNPTRLAWEDALRADTLRNLVTAPLTFGCAAVALTAVGAFGALPLTPLSIVLGVVVPMLLIAAAITIAVIATIGRPQQHFLRMLWPETAAARAR